MYEFYELGADKIYPVSAEHSRGVAELLDALVGKVPGASQAVLDAEEESPIPRIAVIGKPNEGKSSLINHLLGEQRLLVTSEPGTTRDAVDNEIEFQGKKYIFIDTAGLRRKNKIEDKLERISTVRAIRAIERAHLVILMIDAMESATEQDAKLAGLILRRGRACILLLDTRRMAAISSRTTESSRSRSGKAYSTGCPNVSNHAPRPVTPIQCRKNRDIRARVLD